MRYLLGLLLLLSVTLGQVNDKNFKETINGGMVVVVVTAEWQEQDFDKDILKGVKGYQDCEIVTVKSEEYQIVESQLDEAYKALVEFRTKDYLDVYTCLADQGLGVIFKRANKNKLELNIKDFKNLKFRDYYYNNLKFMNIIKEEELLKIV